MYYEQTYSIKDKNGKWVKQPTKIVKFNLPYGKWVQSSNLDKKNGDRTFIVSKPTTTGLNLKVTKATTYFKDNKSKVEYRLITTANKIPDRYF